MWLAPNTITLIGFFFSIAPGIVLFSKYGTSFENGDTPIDSWFFFFYAVCYFAYRMCDEVDGKQARRTKNSSALGMLFDHGCDAYGVNLHILNIMKCLQAGNCFWTMLNAIVFLGGFHFSTLEEYYVGGCYLPAGNAVSDGSVGIIGMLIIIGTYGNDILVTPLDILGGYSIRPFAFALMITTAITVISLCYKYIIDHSKKEIKEGDVTGMPVVRSQLKVQFFGYLFF
jgi:ethanolaminephosphotransferase